VVATAHGYELLHSGDEDARFAGTIGDLEVPDREWKAETGADGSCVLRGIVPGVELSVEVRRDGKVLRKESARVELTPGEERATEWRIGSGCTLKGLALDQQEKPVAGQRILLEANARPGLAYFERYEGDEIVASTSTDTSGHFVFETFLRAAGDWDLPRNPTMRNSIRARSLR
jgi:hypothetical protein